MHTQELDYVVVDGEFYESNLVSQVINKTYLGDLDGTLKATFVYNYTYDANGNITQITDANGNILHKYYYDDLDQIIREDNSPADCSYTYTYDNAGNITSKKQYTYYLRTK